MKNLIFIVLFIVLFIVPISSFSKFYEGDLKYSDGKTVHGFFEAPEFSDKKVNFKPTNDSKTEKILTNDLDEISFIIENKETITLYAKHLYTMAITKKEVPYSQDKMWIFKAYDGKIKFYYYRNSIAMFSKINAQKTDIEYFIQVENRDHPQTFFIAYGGIVMGQFNYVKNVVEVTFKDICPELVNKLDKNEFKNKGVTIIGELYDKNCGIK